MPENTPLHEAFYSSALKCSRGGELIEWLERWAEEHVKKPELIEKYESDTDSEVLALVVHPAPPAISLVVGEIIHNLRGALDYLASSIVSNMSGLKETRVSFPFYQTKADFIGSKKGHRLFQVAPDVWNVIETEFRPYADEDGSRVLWALNRLNNADKHRLLIINNAAGGVFGNHQVFGRGSFMNFDSNSFQMIGAGEMIIARGFQISHQMELSGRLVLVEPETIGTPDLFPFLKECHRLVHSIGCKLQAHIFENKSG